VIVFIPINQIYTIIIPYKIPLSLTEAVRKWPSLALVGEGLVPSQSAGAYKGLPYTTFQTASGLSWFIALTIIGFTGMPFGASL
jgi:hypothetical protein